jgi:hypothetical protein
MVGQFSTNLDQLLRQIYQRPALELFRVIRCLLLAIFTIVAPPLVSTACPLKPDIVAPIALMLVKDASLELRSKPVLS